MAAELDEVRANGLDSLAKLVDVDRVWRHASEDKLCEESVDILGGLEAVEAGDLLVERAHLRDQRLLVLANHVDTMRIWEGRGKKKSNISVLLSRKVSAFILE